MKTFLAAALLIAPAVTPAAGVVQTGANPTPGADLPTTTTTRNGGLLGQAGSLLGGGLPQIGSIGAGNAAGLLGYCVKNKLFAATGGAASGTKGAAGVLGRLTAKRGVENDPGFVAGQAGQVQAANGQTLSLDALRGQLKTQMCNVVLKRARSFL